DASAGFDQIVDFLNTQVIHYALMVNPTIYVSCIKQFWATASIKKVNDVVKLQVLIDRKKVVVTEDIIQQDLRLDDADGVECLPTKKIFAELARMGYEKPPPKLTFYKAFFLPNGSRKFNFSKYIFDNMVRNVDNPSKFLMYPRFLQVLINNQVDDLSSHTIKYTSPTLTQKVFANMRRIGKGFSDVETHLFYTMLVQPQAAAEEEDEKDEVAALKQDKIAQALEIFKLNRRVKKLKKKRGSKSSGLKRLRKGRIERKDNDNAAAKEVNAAEPIVFDDEEVTITMAQTLIKMKDEKTRILDEQMAKRLHDEEVEQAAVREKQEQDDFKRAQELQQQYDQKRKTLTGTLLLSRCKRIILIISRNIDVRPIFEREYNKVQTFLKSDRDEEPTKKRVAKETLLQESFKKLRAEVKVLAYQSFEDMLKAFDREDLDALWRLVKQKFNTAVPMVDKEKALWVELKRLFEPDADDVIWKLQRYMRYPIMWKLHSNCGVHQVSLTTRRHDMYMLAEKEYPLSNEVMTLMLSTKLQVEEDSEMARDLVMKIFMKANQPKSKSLDTSSK
nr:hypothetical protein [Tanacetum cinerariifolium]